MSDRITERGSALEAAFEKQQSHFVVGIDLGTTNCAMAYVDTRKENRRVEVFKIEQLVDFGASARLETLPSFHYELTDQELNSVDKRLRFGEPESECGVVGTLARERTLQVPGRGIGSAKSWLCHTLVDRTSDLLPWQGDEDVQRLSPVEVSRRYLEHLRRAWDSDHPHDPLSEQEVIVTLPASFDEVARQLTLEAAKRAGLNHVILIEEPQAAFYAWLDRHPSDWMQILHSGQSILVCDIGGGTTDFTLIRVIESAVAQDPTAESDPLVLEKPSRETGVRSADASPLVNQKLENVYGLHRVAVGPHLMLGGDNLDLALARHLEQQLVKNSSSKEPLSARQWDVLKAHARSAKETLLGESPPEHYSISIPALGSKIIAGSRTVKIDREWAKALLVDGFFGKVTLESQPDSAQEGFQEFGLPYENEPNVLKHLASFLWDHRWAGRNDSDRERMSDLQAAKPDWVLFNGGVLASNSIRDAILTQIKEWFSSGEAPNWQPGVLEGNRLDLAVAQGAAYFGMVRRGEGIRIDARLARSYYLLVNNAPLQAVCVMPASAVPLDRYTLDDRPFDLILGEPVQFPLYYSSSQLTHAFGELVDVDPSSMTQLPPIQTVLELSRANRRAVLPVHLESELSEIGTLKMRVVSIPNSDPTHASHDEPIAGRWNLEFDVRGGTPGDISESGSTTGAASRGPLVSEDQIQKAISALETIFGSNPTQKPKDCFNTLTDALGMSRRDWPPSVLREIWRYLVDHSDSRKLSPEHEARWLNLAGWSLRPGFGFPADDWRVQSTWRLVHNKLIHRSPANVSEGVILWRRISGGFTTGQQNALFQDTWTRVKPMLGGTNIGREQLNTNIAIELLRLLGSLERLRSKDKASAAELALSGLNKKKLLPLHSALLWMIGRMGNRVPVYATLQQTVPVEKVSSWLVRLLELEPPTELVPSYSLALMLLSRRTGDRYRDVSGNLREKILDRMDELKSPPLHRSLVADGGSLDEDNTSSIVGDTLPLGFSLRGKY